MLRKTCDKIGKGYESCRGRITFASPTDESNDNKIVQKDTIQNFQLLRV